MDAPVTSLSYAEIDEGMTVSHDYVISESVYGSFLAAFHDVSPIHVDDAAARERGFPGRVMHGNILNGFISHFVGCRFPGGRSLLQSVHTKFVQPSHLDDVIRIDARVDQKVDSVSVVVLEMVLHNVTRNRVAARAKVQVGIA